MKTFNFYLPVQDFLFFSVKAGSKKDALSIALKGRVKPMLVSKTHLHKLWWNMICRCYTKTHRSYAWYGGKGVEVCDDWRDFRKFKIWAIKSGYKDNLSIERLHTDKNYEPKNCTWIKRRDQYKNRLFKRDR